MSGIGYIIDAFGFQRQIADALARDSVIESSAKGVTTDHADWKSIGGTFGLRGPLDELPKLVEINRFHIILRRASSLRGEEGPWNEEKAPKCEMERRGQSRNTRPDCPKPRIRRALFQGRPNLGWHSRR